MLGLSRVRWYVLRDSEDALKALEEKWESVQMHTGWKLELCFKPAIHAHDDRNGDIPVTEVRFF